ELIGLGVGVLIVVGPAAVKATAQATKTMPIVAIDLETDPVHAGIAANFNQCHWALPGSAVPCWEMAPIFARGGAQYRSRRACLGPNFRALPIGRRQGCSTGNEPRTVRARATLV